jgi:hypothetical protein
MINSVGTFTTVYQNQAYRQRTTPSRPAHAVRKPARRAPLRVSRSRLSYVFASTLGLSLSRCGARNACAQRDGLRTIDVSARGGDCAARRDCTLMITGSAINVTARLPRFASSGSGPVSSVPGAVAAAAAASCVAAAETHARSGDNGLIP